MAELLVGFSASLRGDGSQYGASLTIYDQDESDNHENHVIYQCRVKLPQLDGEVSQPELLGITSRILAMVQHELDNHIVGLSLTGEIYEPNLRWPM